MGGLRPVRPTGSVYRISPSRPHDTPRPRGAHGRGERAWRHHETTIKSWSALRPLGWRGLGRQIPCAHAPVSSLHAGGLCCDGSRDPPRFVNCLSLRRRPGTVYSPASGGVRLVTSVTGCVRASGPDHVSASGLSTHPRRGPKAIRSDVRRRIDMHRERRVGSNVELSQPSPLEHEPSALADQWQEGGITMLLIFIV